MRKLKIFIAIIVLVLMAIALFKYSNQNKKVQVSSINKILTLNKSPMQIREYEGDNFNKKIMIGIAGPEQDIKVNTRFFKGVQMAVDEINKDGGVLGMNFETISKDDKNTLTGTLEIAQNFANNPNISFVLGHWTSNHTIPAAQIYDGAGVLLITPTSTNPELTQKGYASIFRNTLNDNLIGKKLVVYAQKQGYKNIAIYYSHSNGSALSMAFEKYAKENGINIIDRHTSFTNQHDFNETYRQWKLQGVDAVFIADEMTSARDVVSWVRQQNNRLPILAGDGFDYDNITQYLWKDSENIAFVTFAISNKNSQLYREFYERFKSKFGVEPDYYAVKGYDCIQLIKQALEKAKSTSPSALEKALKSGESFEGVNGPIRFDKNGDLKSGDAMIKQVVNGDLILFNEE